ncbi:hypothetical protein [Tenacibaculum sp. IB213877]|uniref:hypothetical protein n=1 Tax=Tenacibaculum sp. IB213877 TaxID=3097351 RepID=UPI002A59CD1C|nr:hypothetical protein [Tenacibaculum sp. IB213877]MDY0779566.1 hypothetical protein [Tenacibaculum sp. IB213877]
MRTLILKSIFILFITTGFTINSAIQTTANPITVIATFDGYDEFGYNFLFTNDEDEEEIVSFETISAEILKTYNLKDETLKGEQFEITYEYITVEDEDEETTVEKAILKAIKKIN